MSFLLVHGNLIFGIGWVIVREATLGHDKLAPARRWGGVARRFGIATVSIAATLSYPLPVAAWTDGDPAGLWAGTTSDWFTGSNWVWSGGPPASNYKAVINGAATNPVIDSGTSGVASFLVVGGGSAGALTVQGTLTTAQGWLGTDTVDSTVAGTVTVSGASAAWNNSAEIYVGAYSVGSLTVNGGADVTSATLDIGFNQAASGTVLVDGAGSSLVTTGRIGVGRSGTGTLTIQNGATVTDTGAVIGWEAVSTGANSVTVTGTGSTWTNNGAIYIGNSGRGELTVSAGGAVTSTDVVYLGTAAGSRGVVTVTGTGSTFSSLDAAVGWDGVGEITVSNGAAVTTTGNASLGVNNGSSGTALLTGSGSRWNVSGDFNVGLYSGSSGTLTITDGAALSSGRGYVGNDTGSVGRAVISNGGSWTTTGRLFVGADGDGTVVLTSGGRITAPEVVITNSAGTTGILAIGAEEGSAAASAGDVDASLITFRAGNGTVVFNHTDTGLIVRSTISGGGRIKVLAGTTILTGDANHTGGTTISGGTLSIGNGGTTGSISGAIVDNGALIFNRSNDLTYSGALSGSGTLTKVGAGTLTLTGSATHTGGTTINGGTLSVGDGGTTGSISGDIVDNGALIFNRSDDVTYSGALSGSGTLTKVGAGTLTLTGATTLTGVTTISSGTLSIGAGGTTGSISGVIVDNGALIFNRSDDVTYSGALSGTGALTKTGAGKLTLTGATTLTGLTTISSGALSIGAGGTTGSISGDIVDNGELIFNRSNDVTYSGALSGTGTLTKVGAGTLTLTGATTLTGVTTISSGTLSIGAGGTTGSISGAIVDNGALIFNRSDDVTYSGALSGTGTLTKTGAGTLTLTGATTLTGVTTISSGTLSIGAGGTTGSISGAIVDNGALIFNRSDDVTYSGALSGSGTLTKVGAGTLTLTGATTLTGVTTISSGTLSIGAGGTTGSISGVIVDNGALIFNRSDDVTYSGALSGTGALTKTGAGTLTLTGATTLTGLTTISSGALSIGAGGTTGSISGDIVDNGELIFNRSNDVTYSGALSGSGTLTKVGAGTLTLTGATTLTGVTTISSGTLSIGAGGTTGSISGAIVDNGALIFNRSDDVTYSGALSGTGALTKSGAGTLTLTGATTLTGVTTVSSGTLSIASSGFSAGSARVRSGATFAVADGKTAVLSGSYVQDAGAVFRTAVSSASSFGRLSVGGTATLASDATIDVDVSPAVRLARGDVLSRVIGATTVSTGTLNVTDNSALFNFLPSVSGTAVDLVTLAVDRGALLATTSQGAGSAAGAAGVFDVLIFSGGGTSDMRTVVTALGRLSTEAEVATAVAETVPALMIHAPTAAAGSSGATGGMVNARLDGVSVTGSSGVSGLASGDEPTIPGHVWGKTFHSWSSQDNGDGAPGYKSSSFGVVGGVDGDLTERTRVGVALSWTRDFLRGQWLSSGQSAGMDAYAATLYGSYRIDEATSLNLQAGGGFNHVEGKRRIDFGGLDRVARSNYDSPSLRGGLELTRVFRADEATLIVPSLRMDYSWVSDPAYTETGADALNLRVRARTSDTLTAFAGVSASRAIDDRLTVSGRLGAGYDLRRTGRTMRATYVGGGEMFATDGVAPSRWLSRGGLDLTYRAADNVEITASHAAEFRWSFLEQTVALNVRIGF